MMVWLLTRPSRGSVWLGDGLRARLTQNDCCVRVYSAESLLMLLCALAWRGITAARARLAAAG